MQLLCFMLALLNFSASYSAALNIPTTVKKQTSSTVDTSRILYNGSEKNDLFVQWYLVSTRTVLLKKPVTVHRIGSSPISILPHHFLVMKQPQEHIRSEDLRLIVSYKKEVFNEEFIELNNHSPDFLAVELKELQDDNKYKVFAPPAPSPTANNAFIAKPFYYVKYPVVSILNTTNLPLYCAPYSVDSTAKKMASRLWITSIVLNPHVLHLLPYDDADKYKNYSTVLAFTENKDDLHEKLDQKSLSKLIRIEAQKGHESQREDTYVILPPIKDDAFDTDSYQRAPFLVVPPSSIKKPHFFIDEAIARFHELPELTPLERAGIEGDVAHNISLHDNNLGCYKEKDDTQGAKYLVSGGVTELPDEKSFVARRKKVVKKGILELFKAEIASGKLDEDGVTVEDLQDLDLVPSIAFVSTGGGYRAMIETTGFLEGAEAKNVLECCTYMCGLSGSTWAINSLVASQQSVKEFGDSLETKVALQKQPHIDTTTLTKILKNLNMLGVLPKDSPYYGLLNLIFRLSQSYDYKLCKYVQSTYDQGQGFTGLYGHALVDSLLNGYKIHGKKSAHSIMLSDLRDSLSEEEPKYPLPISVCLHSPADAQDSDTCWMEFSPYYVGTYDKTNKGHGWHVPTPTFGSYYRNKALVYRNPEYTLGQLFGIFGSAMALSSATLKTYHAPYEGKMLLALANSLNSNRVGISFDEKRLTAGVVPNFLYHKSSALTTHPAIFKHKDLRLVDGGMRAFVESEKSSFCHNFATMPALQRDCDILILTDCNGKAANQNNTEHLKAVYGEAQHYGFTLPAISDTEFEKIDTKTALIMSDEPKSPSIVYILGQRCDEVIPGFDPDSDINKNTATENFYYETAQYNNLKNLAKGLFERDENINNIKKAILKAIAKGKCARAKVTATPADSSIVVLSSDKVDAQDDYSDDSLLAPAQNEAFDAFKREYPHFDVTQIDEMEKRISLLTADKNYETFRPFINYAAQEGSMNFLKFLMQEAQKWTQGAGR